MFYGESLVVLMIWLAVFASPILLYRYNSQTDWQQVFFTWRGILPFFLLFLISHFFLIPLFLFKKGKWHFVVAAIILIAGFSVAMYAGERYRRQHLHPGERPYMHQPPAGDRFPPPPASRTTPLSFPPFFTTLLVSMLIVGFDTGLRALVRSTRMEQEKAVLEKENVKNQLAFLRAQVSPHFFMNTLNNIHALIDIDADEAKDAVIRLSRLMRHLLYDSQAEASPLHKEVEFIRSYVSLMRLRFSERVDIRLYLPDEIPLISIPPLLFTALIENAFKHGVSYTTPSFIRISMDFAHDFLIFEIENSKAEKKPGTEASGIGIENARKRLKLLYAERFEMTLTDRENTFSAKIKLPL